METDGLTHLLTYHFWERCHRSRTYGIRVKASHSVSVGMDFARWALLAMALPPLRLAGRFYARYLAEALAPNNSDRGWADSSQMIGCCARRSANSITDHGFDISKLRFPCLPGRLLPFSASSAGWGFSFLFLIFSFERPPSGSILSRCVSRV